ncbi:MAG TPA: DUF4118 domain-containing protein [Terriglobales bacterium]
MTTKVITPPTSPKTADLLLHHPIVEKAAPVVSLPFADFVGRCFMYGALCVDMLMSWIQANQPPAPAEMEVASDRYNWHVSGWLRSSIGIAACALAAGALIPLFWSSSMRSLVPIFFLIVISFVALRFGQLAGLFGTLCSALLFASILFEPRPSLLISNPTERNCLICMVIVGICAAELLGRRRHAAVYKPW